MDKRRQCDLELTCVRLSLAQLIEQPTKFGSVPPTTRSFLRGGETED
jgi:hypothetical protein